MTDRGKTHIALMVVVLALAGIVLLFAAVALPNRIAPETIQPSTTVTPSPLEVPPAPPSIAGNALQAMLCLAVWAIPLGIAIVRRGPWSRRSMLESFLGFLGWFVINTYLWFQAMNDVSGAVILNPFRLLPLIVTIGMLLVLGFTKRWAAIGMVAAICANAVATLIVAILFGQVRNGMLTDVMGMMPFYMPFYYPVLWF